MRGKLLLWSGCCCCCCGCYCCRVHVVIVEVVVVVVVVIVVALLLWLLLLWLLLLLRYCCCGCCCYCCCCVAQPQPCFALYPRARGHCTAVFSCADSRCGLIPTCQLFSIQSGSGLGTERLRRSLGSVSVMILILIGWDIVVLMYAIALHNKKSLYIFIPLYSDLLRLKYP